MAKKALKTKSDIVEAVAEISNLPKKDAKAAVEAFVQVAYAGAKQKEGLLLPGLGKFSVGSRKARTGLNPKTGEKIKIPAGKVLKFKIAKAAKDAVLGAKK